VTIYEYSTLRVNMENLEASLTEYSRGGWEVINILPAVYSAMNSPFTELLQVTVVLRSPIGERTEP